MGILGKAEIMQARAIRGVILGIVVMLVMANVGFGEELSEKELNDVKVINVGKGAIVYTGTKTYELRVDNNLYMDCSKHGKITKYLVIVIPMNDEEKHFCLECLEDR